MANLGRPKEGLGNPFNCTLYAEEDRKLKREASKGRPKALIVRNWVKRYFELKNEVIDLKRELKIQSTANS